MASYVVQPFKQRHEGEEITLYLGAVSAEDLIDGRAEIPQYNSADDTGYQRPPAESRIRSLARYVAKGDLLPTALLVNVRGEVEFTANGSIFGMLHVPRDEKLWIMDGQHRFRGLKAASENSMDPLGYDVPVVFTVAFDVESEAGVFVTVNKEAKSVSTDLIATLAVRRDEERISKHDKESEKVSAADRRKAAALRIAETLNRREGSPWFGQIGLADEDAKSVRGKPIRIKVFSSTLQEFLRDRWANAQVDAQNYEPLVCVVDAYWRALRNLMPDAFADPMEYSVQRPIGAYVFNEFLPDVIFNAGKAQDLTEEFFTTELGRLLEWVTSRKWEFPKADRHVDEPIMGTNSRGITVCPPTCPLRNELFELHSRVEKREPVGVRNR